MTTKEILGSNFESMMSYIQRYLNVSKDDLDLISKNPYNAQTALGVVIDRITELVEDIKSDLQNHIQIPLTKLNSIKTVKESVRDYQSQLAEVIRQEEDEANALIKEIEKL
jgi:protein-arginine kinase activator protein McsA